MTQHTELVEKWQPKAKIIMQRFKGGQKNCLQEMDTLISHIIADTEQLGVETGYSLAVKHLSEAIHHNSNTTASEALEWMEDNARFMTPPPQEIKGASGGNMIDTPVFLSEGSGGQDPRYGGNADSARLATPPQETV